MNLKTGRYNAVQSMLNRERAIPAKFSIERLEDPGNFMNKTMQTSIEKAKLEPK